MCVGINLGDFLYIFLLDWTDICYVWPFGQPTQKIINYVSTITVNMFEIWHRTQFSSQLESNRNLEELYTKTSGTSVTLVKFLLELVGILYLSSCIVRPISALYVLFIYTLYYCNVTFRCKFNYETTRTLKCSKTSYSCGRWNKLICLSGDRRLSL